MFNVCNFILGDVFIDLSEIFVKMLGKIMWFKQCSRILIKFYYILLFKSFYTNLILVIYAQFQLFPIISFFSHIVISVYKIYCLKSSEFFNCTVNATVQVNFVEIHKYFKE